VSIRTTTSTVKTDGTGITDTIGNSYTVAKSIVLNNGTSVRVEKWWVFSKAANGSNVITVNLTATSKFTISVETYVGVQLVANANSAAGTGTPNVVQGGTLDPNNWQVIGIADQGTSTTSSASDTTSGLTCSKDQGTVTAGGGASTNVTGAIGSEGPIVAAGGVSNPLLNVGASSVFAAVVLELRSVAPAAVYELVMAPYIAA
jgi:hypothetical protein